MAKINKKTSAKKPRAKAKAATRTVARTTSPPRTKSTTKARSAVSAKSSHKPAPQKATVNKPAKAIHAKNARPAPVIKPVLSARSANSRPSNGKAAKPPLVPGGTLVPPPIAKPKPGKNLAGLSTKELEFFRDLLLQKRRELVGDMSSMEREALQRGAENLSNLPLHMADMGTDNYEQEFTLGLMEKDRQLLREINSALIKINDGTYGICEGTGKPISKVRLEVQPWARYSIEHARKLENRGVR
ncbi:MAG TPA: TraR/DksA C4-type zinc finger protein [Tepidisphaeraceae bacterium]